MPLNVYVVLHITFQLFVLQLNCINGKDIDHFLTNKYYNNVNRASHLLLEPDYPEFTFIPESHYTKAGGAPAPLLLRLLREDVDRDEGYPEEHVDVNQGQDTVSGSEGPETKEQTNGQDEEAEATTNSSQPLNMEQEGAGAPPALESEDDQNSEGSKENSEGVHPEEQESTELEGEPNIPPAPSDEKDGGEGRGGENLGSHREEQGDALKSEDSSSEEDHERLLNEDRNNIEDETAKDDVANSVEQRDSSDIKEEDGDGLGSIKEMGEMHKQHIKPDHGFVVNNTIGAHKKQGDPFIDIKQAIHSLYERAIDKGLDISETPKLNSSNDIFKALNQLSRVIEEYTYKLKSVDNGIKQDFVEETEKPDENLIDTSSRFLQLNNVKYDAAPASAKDATDEIKLFLDNFVGTLNDIISQNTGIADLLR